MSFVRISLDQVNSRDPAPLILNVPLGADLMISMAIPHGGWWGIPKGNHWCRPLIFNPDGKVDFGGDPEDLAVERYGRMLIFGRALDYGERFYLEDFELDVVSEFVVKKRMDLAG